MGICYIIGAGDVISDGTVAEKDDFIICADGGYEYRDMLGREADMVVGDFDSLGRIPEAENRIVLPCEKADTDMAVAIDEGLKKGYRDFVLFGALGGGRIDHSIGNIQLLRYIASKGARGEIRHGKNVLVAFKNSEITFGSDKRGYVSVFSLTDESKGVTIENLKYETDNITMYSHLTKGLSNEFIGKQSRISVSDGILLIVYTL
ncbi:MAG: thiamine diphosphokinase [Clostridia bacterium]|nr:thiamine diphosphokinase [Clostridia bacterium]